MFKFLILSILIAGVYSTPSSYDTQGKVTSPGYANFAGQYHISVVVYIDDDRGYSNFCGQTVVSVDGDYSVQCDSPPDDPHYRTSKRVCVYHRLGDTTKCKSQCFGQATDESVIHFQLNVNDQRAGPYCNNEKYPN